MHGVLASDGLAAQHELLPQQPPCFSHQFSSPGISAQTSALDALREPAACGNLHSAMFPEAQKQTTGWQKAPHLKKGW